MAEDTVKKVKYVGPNGQERLVRADNPAADTAARFDGFLPADEKPKAKAAAPRRAAAEKPAAKAAAAKQPVVESGAQAQA